MDFDTAKDALSQGKIILKIQLTENKEVTSLM